LFSPSCTTREVKQERKWGKRGRQKEKLKEDNAEYFLMAGQG